jgi:hypothetical protein
MVLMIVLYINMKLITLHDSINPDVEVIVDADSIVAITPFGSGSSIMLSGGTVGVHETAEQIMQVINS